MSHPSAGYEKSLVPDEGWHCTHLFYQWDRAALASINQADRSGGRTDIERILNTAFRTRSALDPPDQE